MIDLKGKQPSAYLSITNSISLMIRTAYENGDSFVYSAFYSAEDKTTCVTKAKIQISKNGNPFFVKYRQRTLILPQCLKPRYLMSI